MLMDDGPLRPDNGRWVAMGDLSGVRMAPFIQALIAARLDRLEGDERHVIERAAVEGKVFHQGSVRALAEGPARERVGTCLHSLVRKELIRPDKGAFAAEDGRFRHALIREAAYDSIPMGAARAAARTLRGLAVDVAGLRGASTRSCSATTWSVPSSTACNSVASTRARSIAFRGGSRPAAAGRRACARRHARSRQLTQRAASLLDDGAVPQVPVLVDLGRARERGDLREAESARQGRRGSRGRRRRGAGRGEHGSNG